MWLRLLIGIIVVYLLYRFVKGDKLRQGSRKRDLPPAGEDLVQDPVCHAYVPLSRACRTSIDGETRYFCSNECLERYRKENIDNERKTS